MVTTEELERIIKENQIIKKFSTLPEKVLGYYSFDGIYKIILLNNNLLHNERLYRIVLAEEIGHYKVTAGDITPTTHINYIDKLIIEKKEMIALKWAIEFLIPTDFFLNLIKEKHILNQNELAEIFNVTEEFILKKFEFMAKKMPIWNLDDKRYLYLYKLPSVFIFEKFHLNNL